MRIAPYPHLSLPLWQTTWCPLSSSRPPSLPLSSLEGIVYQHRHSFDAVDGCWDGREDTDGGRRRRRRSPRGTVCTDGGGGGAIAAAQDPSRSFIATAAAAAAFLLPPLHLGPPSARPSVQPSLAGSSVDVGKGRALGGGGMANGRTGRRMPKVLNPTTDGRLSARQPDRPTVRTGGGLGRDVPLSLARSLISLMAAALKREGESESESEGGK